MDEINSSTVVSEQEVTPVADHDDWDDIDLSDVTDNDPDATLADEPKPADQPAENEPEGTEEDPPEAKEPETEQAETDQSFTLKHLDRTVTVGRDEVVALAQKGMDYDRIREDRDQARGEVARLSEMEAFLKELAAPGNMSVEDLMDTTRANLLAEREGIDPGVALQRVKLEKDRKALEAQRQSAARQTQAEAAEQAEAQRRQESIDRFVRDHRDLKAEDIPKAVWDAFLGGKDLADAYAHHEAKTLRDELSALRQENETLKQNQKNQARSTGSQNTAGSHKETENDVFDKLWYDGT